MNMILRNGRPSHLAITTFAAAVFIVCLLTVHVFRSGGPRKVISGVVYTHGNQMAHGIWPPPPDRRWERDTKEYILDDAWDGEAPVQSRYYNWSLTEVEGNPDGLFTPSLRSRAGRG